MLSLEFRLVSQYMCLLFIRILSIFDLVWYDTFATIKNHSIAKDQTVFNLVISSKYFKQPCVRTKFVTCTLSQDGKTLKNTGAPIFTVTFAVCQTILPRNALPPPECFEKAHLSLILFMRFSLARHSCVATGTS